ncbi:MAG: hypothetical protein ABSG92_03200 [Conexivisphaerales archaeon]|jgi:hypothetical protein
MPLPEDDPAARIVRAIIQVGPGNYSLISRLTGIPPETVRYKIKNQLYRRGVAIHALIDAEKFDLQRYIVMMSFSDSYQAISKYILQSLHELAYLTYYSGQLMSKEYYCLFQTPRLYKSQMMEFLDEMVNLGILTGYSLKPIIWVNYLSLRPEYYDFQEGRWDIDWQALSTVSEVPKIGASSEYDKNEYDKMDILLAKELALNSLSTVAEMSKKLNINVKTLQYHYNSHVLERKMVTKYIVRWMGDLESIKKHRIIYGRVFAKDLSQSQLQDIRKAFYSIPFTWSEAAAGNRDLYLVEMAVPVEHYLYVQYYLNNSLGSLAECLDFKTIDVGNSLAFTIPHSLYDSVAGSWSFPLDENVKKLQNLRETLKQNPG